LLPSGDVVTPDIRDAERFQGFDPDWTLAAAEVERKSIRWRLVGNAVTVPVAKWVGDRLLQPGRHILALDSDLPPGSPWPNAAWGDGRFRYAATISKFPRPVRHPPLADWLEYDRRPLSEKATRGFVTRAKESQLRWENGFIEALEDHLARVAGAARA
jgi:DNA (cytosine-5)-methyltransferase 1